MQIKKSVYSGLLAAAVLAMVPHTASAWSPKLEVSDSTWVQLGYLHQFWYESVDEGAADGSRSNDFFTRRNRIMLLGQATDDVFFFVNYDAAAGGASGTRQDPVLTDAFIDYRISPAFNVMVGRQLVPFSIDNQASAVSLTAIDYPTRALAPLPTNPSGAFWRDDGIQIRGVLDEGFFAYRAGYFRGAIDGANTREDGRFTGMVMVNLASPQGGWFFNTNSLGALDVLSFGVGFDQMGRSDQDDHKAVSLFGAAEKTLGVGHLSVTAAWFDWQGVGDPTNDFYDGGNTAHVTAAFLPTGSKWQPVIRWQSQTPDDDGRTLDTFGLGLAYYISGHRANIKAEYSINDNFENPGARTGERIDAFRVGAQLFF